MIRRRFLVGGATITALGAGSRPSLAHSKTIPSASIRQAANRELAGILARAEELKLAAPRPAAAGPPNPLDLAELINQALESRPADENAGNIARRAGLLLSELTRDQHDGVDFIPSDATPASTRYIYSTQLKQQYGDLFRKAKVNQADVRELSRAANFITSPAAFKMYQTVQGDTGVPWYVVGALHYREANCNFMGHLHNGDPLLMQTIHVPINRPPRPWVPPATSDPRQLWRLSAKDALQGFTKLVPKSPGWTVERMCYIFEAYNGFGCRANRIPSPYLWNYTQWYTSGGFPRDHDFERSYISRQAGVAAIIVMLHQVDSTAVALEFET
jgi:lysozyme family protein